MMSGQAKSRRAKRQLASAKASFEPAVASRGSCELDSEVADGVAHNVMSGNGSACGPGQFARAAFRMVPEGMLLKDAEQSLERPI